MACTYFDSTTIGSYTYLKLGLSGMQSYNTILVREDGNGQVFFRYENDTFEQAFFDYNANIGDTLVWKIKNDYTKNYSTQTNIITSIDSIQINGVWHKQFYKGNRILLYGEGIGSRIPLFHSPTWHMGFGGGSPHYKGFICFKNNSAEPTYSQNVYNFDCMKIVTIGINKISRTDNKLIISPQPASSIVNIELANETTGSLSLVNSVGQMVYKENFTQQSKLVISRNEHIISGMYIYHILDNKTGTSYTGKLSFK
jgi:hypothetical protein